MSKKALVKVFDTYDEAAATVNKLLKNLGIEKSLANRVWRGDMIQENKILVIVHGDEDAVEIAKKALDEK